MKNKKELILDVLKEHDKLSTTAISNIIVANQGRTLKLLLDLMEEKKVRMIKETYVTFWRLR